MKPKTTSLILAAVLAFVGSTYAGPANTYQVTGPILEVNDSMIAVQKGKDRWEIIRDATTKSDATLKAGDKVTVTYTMTATEVKLKADKQARAEDKASAKPAASPKK
ncbi:MAG: hypothetical protein M3Y86_00550 [Verrucomicrobiota bacterium]|nr:hypothetical protein [Verrucomicrobiota bacterium]